MNRTETFKNTSWFLVFLGLLAWSVATWSVLQSWRVRTYGDAVQVGVTRIWQETSQSFTFYRNGRVHDEGFTHHLEVALLEAVVQAPQTEPPAASTEPPLTAHNIATVGALHTEQALQRIDGLMERIRAATKPVAIPASAPRFQLSHVPEHLVSKLYSGKVVGAKRLGDAIWLDGQYEQGVPAQAQVLFALGLIPFLLAVGLRVYSKIRGRR